MPEIGIDVSQVGLVVAGFGLAWFCAVLGAGTRLILSAGAHVRNPETEV